MKLTRMLGLAAVAAIAAMAFVGVGSASATELEEVVLCKTDPALASAKCPASFGTGTVLHAELKAGTEAVLNGGFFGKIKCTSSATLGTTTSPLAHGEITALSFGGCKFGATACGTVEPLHLNYLIKGELNAAHNGYEAIVKEKANGTPEVHVVCGGFVNCTFSSATTLFEQVLETNDVVLKVNQTVNNSGGGLCPPTSVWEAQYLTRCLEGGNLVGCWLRME